MLNLPLRLMFLVFFSFFFGFYLFFGYAYYFWIELRLFQFSLISFQIN